MTGIGFESSFNCHFFDPNSWNPKQLSRRNPLNGARIYSKFLIMIERDKKFIKSDQIGTNLIEKVNLYQLF